MGSSGGFLGFAPALLVKPRSGVFTEMMVIAHKWTRGSFVDFVVLLN